MFILAMVGVAVNLVIMFILGGHHHHGHSHDHGGHAHDHAGGGGRVRDFADEGAGEEEGPARESRVGLPAMFSRGRMQVPWQR